jgi:hypothetical protein
MRSLVALLFYVDYKCSTQAGFRKTLLVLMFLFVFLLWSPWRPLICPVFGVCTGSGVRTGVARMGTRVKRRLAAPQPIQTPAEHAVPAAVLP